MGVVAKAVTGVIDEVLGTSTQEDFAKLTESDPLIGFGEKEVLSQTDEAIFGTSLEDLEKPLVLPPAEADVTYESRESPAILRTESDVELLSEEELEEQALLGKSKKNRLRIPLTGGIDTPTAGVGAPTATPSATPSASGLQI